MNPVLFDFGIIKIHTYSMIIFVGLILGIYLTLRETKKFKIPEDFTVNMFLLLIPISVIGARIYYVLFNWEVYSDNFLSVFKIWEGGLAIHGAIIAGLIYTVIYSLKYKVKPLLMIDIMVVGLILGQAIGRWGNFFNQEAYGTATTLEALQALPIPEFIINGMNIGGTYYMPTFLYESLWCLLGFVLLLFWRRRRYVKIGQIGAFYLIWYGIGRIVIESFRTDSLMLGDIKMAQLMSAIMIVGGLLLYFKTKGKSKFDDRYNDENLNYDNIKF